MRILHTVFAYEPDRGGSQEVVKQISERLAARGHEVAVATSPDRRRAWRCLNGVEVLSFNVGGNAVTGFTGDRRSYERFLLEFDGDVILNYAAQCWTTDLMLGLLDEIRCKKVMVPCGYSRLFDAAYADYFRRLPEYLSRYDALVYMSPNYRDKKFGDAAGLGEKAVIIPNGAAAEEFDAEPAPFRAKYGIDTKYMLLTVSNHYRLKGHARMFRALESLRRDDVTLVIIGEPPRAPWRGCYLSCRTRALTNRRVRVLTGLSRPDILAAYKAADVLLLASDVECSPLVIYEAMAAGLPFVATDCGDVRDNSAYGVVVDSPAGLTTGITELLSDEAKRRVLGQAGHHAWREFHTWDAITDAYEQLYRALVVPEVRPR